MASKNITWGFSRSLITNMVLKTVPCAPGESYALSPTSSPGISANFFRNVFQIVTRTFLRSLIANMVVKTNPAGGESHTLAPTPFPRMFSAGYSFQVVSPAGIEQGEIYAIFFSFLIVFIIESICQLRCSWSLSRWVFRFKNKVSLRIFCWFLVAFNNRDFFRKIQVWNLLASVALDEISQWSPGEYVSIRSLFHISFKNWLYILLFTGVYIFHLIKNQNSPLFVRKYIFWRSNVYFLGFSSYFACLRKKSRIFFILFFWRNHVKNLHYFLPSHLIENKNSPLCGRKYIFESQTVSGPFSWPRYSLSLTLANLTFFSKINEYIHLFVKSGVFIYFYRSINFQKSSPDCIWSIKMSQRQPGLGIIFFC